ncbi:Lactose permease [Fusarium oxysporum f. sp. raphani]|uniref:Lactose permease n=1 Tax=Fusarium oxysporum f. sp. raphani TaxID=96318 RepID=A0A8J5Q210_FUSOX|nr:Lactose permease [Fusarium oxysporum f. sp. raphani]
MAIISEEQRDINDVPSLPDMKSVLPPSPKPWWRTPHLLKLNFLLTVPMITGYLIGFDSSMLNGLQSVPIWNKDFDYPSGARLAVLGTMRIIGAIVSLQIAPYVADRRGRRLPVFGGSTFALVGTALQSAAHNLDLFLAGRFLVGFGTGVVGVASNPLLAELAYPAHRRFLTSFGATTWFLGAIVAAWSTYGTFKLESSWSWRIPSILQAVPSLYQAMMIYFTPESPRWLISHGRSLEARKILNKYHAGIETEPDVSPLVEYEMAETETAIELEKIQNTGSYMAFFATTAHWAGNGLISFYLVIVLRSIGIDDPEDQNLINGGLTVFCYIVSIIGATSTLRFGRRTILLFGFAGMAISYLIWTVLSSVNQQRNFKDSGLGYGVVAMIFLYQLFYNLSINPQICTYGAGLFNGFVNPIAMEALDWKYYIVWVVMLCVWLILIWFLFPETAGRTLEEARIPILDIIVVSYE